MFFSSIKEINWLISKGMSNIYLKVTIELLKTSLSLKKIRLWEWEVWEKKCERLFYYFNFERNYDVLKSRSPDFLLNKNIKTLIKTKRNRKWKIPHTLLERQTLGFSPYKNRELKVKLP